MGDIGFLKKIQVVIMNYLHHLKDTEKSLQKHEKVLEYLPTPRPPNKGVKHKVKLTVGTPLNMIPFLKHPIALGRINL